MVRMTMSIEKVLADARLLCSRLKEHDACADNLITQGTTLHKRMDAMKQYEEDMNELNEIARHRPRANLILGLAQENSQIRELQQENRDLRVALEEHQSALELIMKKYREQVAKLLAANRLDRTLVHKSDDKSKSDTGTPGQIDKICEMAAVMREAIKVDEEGATRDKQLLVQLRHENKTLREILQITGGAAKCIKEDTMEKMTQTGEEESARGGRESGESLGSSGEVADILRQLDLPEEGDFDDTETESESEANNSMISTIKRGTSIKDMENKTSSEDSSKKTQDDESEEKLADDKHTSDSGDKEIEEESSSKEADTSSGSDADT